MSLDSSNDVPIRVLLIAEKANPEMVSVPLVGWSHCRAIAELEGVDAHLVTQVRNREAIERAGWREGERFTAIDSETIARPMWRVGTWLRGGTSKAWTVSSMISSLSYYYFEHLVWRRFGKAIAEGAYDVVHRVTPLSPTAASLIARRCARAGVPFVVGPLNGGLPWPSGFGDVLRKEREWLSYLRGLHRLMPGYGSTRRHAAAIIAASRDVLRQIDPTHHDKCVYIPENGIDPQRFPDSEPIDADATPLRVAFVGRLVPYKGADVLIEAAAPLIRNGNLHVTVFGDGPQRDELRAMVERLGVGDGVEMVGWIDHRQLHERLSRCHVLGFPSIREFGGGVVLEAMALGLVPVVVDYGGPGELVTDATGYRLPLSTRDALVADLREALARLADDRAELARLRDHVRPRIRRWFTWHAKATQTREVYRWVTGRRERPDFGVPFPDEDTAEQAAVSAAEIAPNGGTAA